MKITDFFPVIINFWNKYKVLIVGLVSSIIEAISALDMSTPNMFLLGYAVLTGVASFIAHNLRGQYASILGIAIGGVITVMTTVHNGGHINWTVLALTLLGQINLILSGPAKLREYEHSPTVVQAKEEAAEIKTEKTTVPQ